MTTEPTMRVPYDWLSDQKTWVKRCSVVREFWDGSVLCQVRSQRAPIVITNTQTPAATIDEVVVLGSMSQFIKVSRKVSLQPPLLWQTP
jgi:hypothetical protein